MGVFKFFKRKNKCVKCDGFILGDNEICSSCESNKNEKIEKKKSTLKSKNNNVTSLPITKKTAIKSGFVPENLLDNVININKKLNVINEVELKIDRVEYDGGIYRKSGLLGKELKGDGDLFFENPLVKCELISEDGQSRTLKHQPPSIAEICRHFNPKDPTTEIGKAYSRISFQRSDEYFKDRDYRKRLKIINNYCFIEEYINYLRPFSGKIIILSDESISIYQEGKLINEYPPIKTDTTISSDANIGVNQKLPIWFTTMEDVKIYDEGDTVINWGGKEIELNNIELSMYHYLMGAKMILDNGMDEKVWFAYNKGIDWFRKNNPKAYMELFD